MKSMFSYCSEHRLATLVCSGPALTALALMLGACSSGEPLLDAESEVEQLRDGSLHVTLQPLAEGTGSVEYQITNTGIEPVRVLERDTALNGVFSNLLEVDHAGKPVRYIAERVVYLPPRLEDFIELAPGETQTRAIALDELYELQPGEYSVRARPIIATLMPREGLGAGGPLATAQVSVDESPLAVSVSERYLAGSGEVEKAFPGCIPQCEANCLSAGDPASIGQCIAGCPQACMPGGSFDAPCTATQESNIASARARASQMAEDGAIAVDTNPLYETWFGVRSDGRVRRVRNLLEDISSDVNDFEHMCLPAGRVVNQSTLAGCAGGGVQRPINAATGGQFIGDAVAFCPDFFSNTAARRAAIVVHESSHRQGTDDVVASEAGALDLARTNPELATQSAENYERYAQNF